MDMWRGAAVTTHSTTRKKRHDSAVETNEHNIFQAPQASTRRIDQLQIYHLQIDHLKIDNLNIDRLQIEHLQIDHIHIDHLQIYHLHPDRPFLYVVQDLCI